MTESWMASVVRKAGTLHGKCWMTLRAGVVEMGKSSKAQSARARTWGVINRTSAVNWEIINRKLQRRKKAWMFYPAEG